MTLIKRTEPVIPWYSAEDGYTAVDKYPRARLRTDQVFFQAGQEYTDTDVPFQARNVSAIGRGTFDLPKRVHQITTSSGTIPASVVTLGKLYYVHAVNTDPRVTLTVDGVTTSDQGLFFVSNGKDLTVSHSAVAGAQGLDVYEVPGRSWLSGRSYGGAAFTSQEVNQNVHIIGGLVDANVLPANGPIQVRPGEDATTGYDEMVPLQPPVWGAVRTLAVGDVFGKAISGNNTVAVGIGSLGAIAGRASGSVSLGVDSGGSLGNVSKTVLIGFKAGTPGGAPPAALTPDMHTSLQGVVAIGAFALSVPGSNGGIRWDNFYKNIVAVGESATLAPGVTKDAVVVGTNATANSDGSVQIGENSKPFKLGVGNSGYGAAGQVLTVNAAGDGVEWAAAASSRKVKRDIEELTLSEAQSQFDALEAKTFTYTDDASMPAWRGTRQAGFIAEELADAGMFVEVDEDGDPRDLSERNLIAVLWKVVKDQQDRIAALEARLP